MAERSSCEDMEKLACEAADVGDAQASQRVARRRAPSLVKSASFFFFRFSAFSLLTSPSYSTLGPTTAAPTTHMTRAHCRRP